jgi:hypothetical protein
MADVALVSAHYYPNYLRASLKVAQRLKRTLSVDRHVAVFTGPAMAATEPPDGVEVVMHDNQGQEFGAYQAGLDHVFATGCPEWVVFANDTLGLHAPLSRVGLRIAAGQTALQSTLPIVVGIEDRKERSFRVGTLVGNRWMRTHWFALNAPALEALGRRIRAPEVEALVPGDATMDTFFAPDLDDSMRMRLETWLFGAGPPADQWYDSAPLTEANAARMAGKARAVLQEAYLSLRLEQVSTIFVNVRNTGLLGRAVMKVENAAFRPQRPQKTSG